MDTLELATSAAHVRIAPAIGGAIAAFSVHGVPILRPMSAAAIDVRDSACYPLVPYSNRIRDATLHFAGRAWPLQRNFGTSPHSIHGVGWQRRWDVMDAERDHARLRLAHDARGDAALAWPWPFVATLAYHLHEKDDEVRLGATLALRNTGDASFPFGLGFHPFLARDRTTRLGLAADAVWRNDPEQLPREKVAVPAAWRFAPPRRLDDIVLDNVFTGWSGRATIDDERATRVIEGDRALAFAVVYAPRDADFVAVEPVTHETDAFNRAARGEAGTGTRVLRPGDAFSCTMRIAARASVPAAR